MSGQPTDLLRNLLGRLSPSSSSSGRGPRALVYRGPASLPGCPEAVAELLRASSWSFDVRFVGPDEQQDLSDEAFHGVTLYAQPGGDLLVPGYRHLRPHRKRIRRFVRGGGKYLGFCLGGYLAGATPGFGLLPGDTDRYISTKGSTVDTDGDALIAVSWRDRSQTLYFQDGPEFVLRRKANATVLATYPNGRVAALVAPFGEGHVGVVGPHPEAGPHWFTSARLTRSSRHAATLAREGRTVGLDLLDEVMAA